MDGHCDGGGGSSSGGEETSTLHRRLRFGGGAACRRRAEAQLLGRTPEYCLYGFPLAVVGPHGFSGDPVPDSAVADRSLASVRTQEAVDLLGQLGLRKAQLGHGSGEARVPFHTSTVATEAPSVGVSARKFPVVRDAYETGFSSSHSVRGR